jgi:hypothetical protein
MVEMDVAEWLRTLGLEQYAPGFRQNEIDQEVLPELTDADLEKLGVPMGHRKTAAQSHFVVECRRPGRGLSACRTAADRYECRAAPADGDVLRSRRLVGSTALSARLDPEDLRAVIGAYHRSCAAVIERAGGFVAKYMGDGVLAYFGYPRADEHDAERAARAGRP